MDSNIVGFNWVKWTLGYELRNCVSSGPSERKLRGLHLVAIKSPKRAGRGPEVKTEREFYRPEKELTLIFNNFIGVKDKRTALDFVRRFGFLGISGQGIETESEQIQSIVEAANDLRQVNEFLLSEKAKVAEAEQDKKSQLRKKSPKFQKTDDIGFRAVIDTYNLWASFDYRCEIADSISKPSKLSFVIVPPSLLAALYLELSFQITGHWISKICEGCNQAMLVNADSPRDLKRKYHLETQDACKMQHFRRSKKFRKAV